MSGEEYDAAVANFRYDGGAVRLIDKIEDPIVRAREWGHKEKDEYTLPFGPWSKEDNPSSGPWVYRYGTASAATGSRYAVLVTRVHGDVGSREGNVAIVTVLSPWRSAYPFAADGFLHHSYVEEKLLNGRTCHGGDVAAITTLIGILLGRETS